MRIKTLFLAFILSIFFNSITQATPYIDISFSGNITEKNDPGNIYNFELGSFNGSVILHGEGLIDESNNDYHDYYLFNRDYVEIYINEKEIIPIYNYYHLVRLSYSKTEDLWDLSAISVDKENFREGTVNQTFFYFKPFSKEIFFYDHTEEIDDGIEITDIRYEYLGTLNKVTGEKYELIHAPPSIPEPTTMLLFGIGLLGIAGVSRRRIKNSPLDA